METKQYHLTLRFDDENHSLTKYNGLSIKEVGELLLSLYQAIHVKPDELLVLSEVRGNCYALDLSTQSYSIQEELKGIHSKISENNFEGFSTDQLQYANKLKAVMGGRLFLSVYDEGKNYRQQINDFSLPKLPEYYFEQGSISGTITSIGSSSLDSTIYIKIDREPYKISISKSQENELVKHYKSSRLRLLLRKKIGYQDDKIKSAELIDFELLNTKTFYELAHDYREKYGNDTE